MVDGSSVTHLFVLIHGTFARGAAWTGDDSKLAKALRDGFPACKIQRFLWTGANSHSGRLAAADALRQIIRASSEECPQARIHLVGHSHGGNVALYALRDASIEGLVTSLVCISTPFIKCTGRDTDKLLVRASLVFSGLLITAVELLCFYIGVRVGAVGLVMLAGNLLVFNAVNIGTRRLGPKMSEFLYEKQKSIVRRLDPGFVNATVLVVRVARDEAALLLRSSYLVARVPHLVNLIGLLALLSVVAAVVLSLFSFGPLAHKSVDAVYTTWFAVSMVALATYGLIATVTFLVRSHPLAFGWEGLFDGLFVDLNINITPDFPVVEKKFKVRRRFRLRHSALYEDEECVRLLPDWVRIVEMR